MSKNCIFCKIASGEVKGEIEKSNLTCLKLDLKQVLITGTELIYTDEDYVAFRDHRPAASNHFLIIPKNHYPGIKHLKREDIPIVRDLERLSHKVGLGHTESL